MCEVSDCLIEFGLCHCGCGGLAPITPYNNISRGWVRGQPLRYINGHARNKSPVDYIVDENGCWVWQKSLARGYGKLRVDGKTVSAHRYFYEKFIGPIPVGMTIDHVCKNKKCCNPKHLEVVTQAENNRRRSSTKLNIVTATWIRHIHDVTGFTHQKIADIVVVERRQVSRILHNDIWEIK